MKKILYSFFALAALSFAAGCNREVDFKTGGGPSVKADFDLNFAKVATKALSDGSQATALAIAVYDVTDAAAPEYLANLTKNVTIDPAAGESISFQLVKGRSYELVFWAQAPGVDYYTVDLAAGTVTVENEGLLANDDKRDAFYAAVTTGRVSEAFSKTVTLKRPLAQVNVISKKDDYEAAVAAGVTVTSTSMTLEAPDVLNLLDGSVADTRATYAFAPAAIADTAPNFGAYAAAGDYIIASNYVLASEASATTSVSFGVYRNGSDTDLLNTISRDYVPVQRNYRTNFYGYIITTTGQFVITLDPEFSGSHAVDFEAEVPQISFSNPLIDPTNPAAVIPVTGNSTMSFAATHPVAEVPASYDSSNPEVGTIDAAGTFTPLANGTTNITIAFPEVIVEGGVVTTKSALEDAHYSAYSLTVPVEVSGIVEGGEEPDPVDEEIFVKATVAEAGQFLIVYEDGSLAFDSTLDNLDATPNTVAVEISDGTIAATDALKASAFTIAAVEGGYSIKSSSGKYIGKSNDANGLDQSDEAVVNTISINEDGSAQITAAGTAVLRYNASSGQTKFRYYKSSTYTGQKAVALYKLSGSTAGEDPSVEPDPEPVLTTATIELAVADLTVEVGATVAIEASTNSDAVISYLSNDETVATVAADGVITGVAAGSTTITVSVAETANFTAAQETVNVSVVAANDPDPEENHGKIESDPLSVAEALAIINETGSTSTSDNYYVKGVVTGISEIGTSYGNATYFIGENVYATENLITVFRGKNLENANFASANDLTVGDEVVVVGTLVLYNGTTPEINQGNYLVSNKRAATITLAASELSLTVGNTSDLNATTNGGAITYSSNNEAVATVADGVVIAVATGSAIITVKVAGTDDYAETYKTVAVEVTAAGTSIAWVKKGFADLVTGDVIVIVAAKSDGSTFALPGSNGSSSAPSAAAVTVSDDRIASPDNSWQWTVTVNDGSYIFSQGGNAIYCINNNNGVRVGTGVDNVFEIDGGYLKNKGQGRYLCVYNTQDWRCYTTSTTTNAANQTFAAYVKTTVSE